ncbi:hypothetical protein RRG08_025650 [Elysia crispata]|uniref:Uncharacterized protein n=1 Tax=Elysia crispata TaxID=231223 RepID=A0AAE0YE68_9GAST|nr:hypothetical protein RRG08_025650 [Elysia crispata]
MIPSTSTSSTPLQALSPLRSTAFLNRGLYEPISVNHVTSLIFVCPAIFHALLHPSHSFSACLGIVWLCLNLDSMRIYSGFTR